MLVRPQDRGTGEGTDLRIRLLGGFSVTNRAGVRAPHGWRLHKARSLVKLLALAPGHRLHREQVMASLWPDLGPDAAANNFYQALHYARRVIDPPDGPTYLPLEREIVRLEGEGLWIDVDAFVEAARRARGSRDVDALREAVALYGGDLLPEDLYEEWTVQQREHLQELYHGLILALARSVEASGDVAGTIDALQGVLVRDQANEPAHRALMRLYAIAGERTKALRQFEALRQILRQDLDVEPDAESQRLFDEIAAGRFPVREHAGSVLAANLPLPPTRLIGRDRDLTALQAALSESRLLTLVGGPGHGKSRLALEVGHAGLGVFPHGVFLVDLSATDPVLLVQTVAATLGLSEVGGLSIADVLASHLKDRRLLLILDNCEHVLGAAGDLAARLLAEAPELRILATSRAPLEVTGERLWEVHPLAVPGPDTAIDPAALRRAEAVQFFEERARAHRPSFGLTPENAYAVATICRGLDGIPLALELAAAQLRTLSPEQIAQRLDEAMAFATPHRATPSHHHTLDAALTWSYDLLTESEREVFRRLAVFPGSFSLDAAEAVCNGTGGSRVVSGLTRLVRGSLVAVDLEGRENHYRLLETVRRFALERLRAAGEIETTRAALIEWSTRLAREAETGMGGAGYAGWLARLDSEGDTVRAALEAARELDPQAGLQLAGALWPFWEARGAFSEGRRWAEDLLASDADRHGPGRGRALLSAGTMATRQGALPDARRLLGESLALFRDAGDRWGIAWALDNLGMVALAEGRYQEARQEFLESLSLFRELGDERGVGCALDSLGWEALLRGDGAQAQRHFEESLARFRAIGDRRGMGRALGNLANLARVRGDPRRAQALARESVQFCGVGEGGRPTAAGRVRKYVLRSLLVKLHGISWGGAVYPVTVPCAGVCAGYPLLAGVFASSHPIWVVGFAAHFIALPLLVPVNLLLLALGFRRHRRPAGFLLGIAGGLMVLAALTEHLLVAIPAYRLYAVVHDYPLHDLVLPGAVVLLVAFVIDWLSRRRPEPPPR